MTGFITIYDGILMEINWCQRKKPQYEENSIQPRALAQIEQIFSETGWNFLHIVVSSKDTSLFTIYNMN